MSSNREREQLQDMSKKDEVEDKELSTNLLYQTDKDYHFLSSRSKV